ncbi:MAG: cupin domain-containing protein [Candidatus Nanopelagicales bacterium]
MERNDLGRVIVDSAADIDAIEWIANDATPGVRHKVLWQSGATVLGLMQIDGGAINPEHTHHAAHHHILILDGTCHMMGKDVGPGSYVYVPPGVPHEAANNASTPCTFFYTYRPLEMPTGDDDLIIA